MTMIGTDGQGILLIFSDGANTKILVIKTNSVIKCFPEASMYVCLSPSGKKFAYCTAGKIMKTGSVNEEQCFTFKIPKKPSKMLFNETEDLLLVADKFGDVMYYDTASLTVDEANSLVPLENKGNILMGHVSLVTDAIFTPDFKKIITCDKDEKIRVTTYPKTYIIRGFCFGHTSFVSTICCPPSRNDILFSGGKELKVFVWSLSSYEIISTLDLNEFCLGTQNTFIEKISCLNDDHLLVSFYRLPLYVLLKLDGKDQLKVIKTVKLDDAPISWCHRLISSQIHFITCNVNSGEMNLHKLDVKLNPNEDATVENLDIAIAPLSQDTIHLYLNKEKEMLKHAEEEGDEDYLEKDSIKENTKKAKLK